MDKVFGIYDFFANKITTGKNVSVVCFNRNNHYYHNIQLAQQILWHQFLENSLNIDVMISH